ncbi:uncharacterized protein RBU33_026833 isoform 2-T9 [Hipposideros larvatus]
MKGVRRVLLEKMGSHGETDPRSRRQPEAGLRHWVLGLLLLGVGAQGRARAGYAESSCSSASGSSACAQRAGLLPSGPAQIALPGVFVGMVTKLQQAELQLWILLRSTPLWVLRATTEVPGVTSRSVTRSLSTARSKIMKRNQVKEERIFHKGERGKERSHQGQISCGGRCFTGPIWHHHYAFPQKRFAGHAQNMWTRSENVDTNTVQVLVPRHKADLLR